MLRHSLRRSQSGAVEQVLAGIDQAVHASVPLLQAARSENRCVSYWPKEGAYAPRSADVPVHRAVAGSDAVLVLYAPEAVTRRLRRLCDLIATWLIAKILHLAPLIGVANSIT